MKANQIFFNKIGYLFLFCLLSTLILESCKKKQDEIFTQKPTASFNYTILNDGSMPCEVSFQNTSRGGQTYEWTFGDGQTSTVENTNNTYASSQTFNVKLVVSNTTGKDSVVKQVKISKIKYSVRIFLITPTDRAFNQKYYEALKMCASNLQNWYRQQMSGKTFVLNNPIIDTLRGTHTYDWYNQYNGAYSGTNPRNYGYNNTLYEVQQVIGKDLDINLYMNAIYVAAPEGGAGSKGFCALGDQDLNGLLGINPTNGNINRWIGGSGNVWGLGFGLQNPPGQEPQALMWSGLYNYPNCILLQADKDVLNNSNFFK